MKTCATCSESKSDEEFYRGKANDASCKPCRLKLKRQVYADRKAGILPTRTVESATCPDCALEKPATDFGVDHHRPTGLKIYCRACVVDRNRAGKLNISLDEARLWRGRLAEGCQACGSHERLTVDHDHQSGVVRGVLCDDCNVTLGKMKDSPDRLLALAAYLLQQVDLLAEV